MVSEITEMVEIGVYHIDFMLAARGFMAARTNILVSGNVEWRTNGLSQLSNIERCDNIARLNGRY